jgi:hypothetical protein
MTAQRFMSARNERHAMGGQLFQCGDRAFASHHSPGWIGDCRSVLFWSKELTEQIGPAPEGVKFIENQAYAWGELINSSAFPLVSSAC